MERADLMFLIDLVFLKFSAFFTMIYNKVNKNCDKAMFKTIKRAKIPLYPAKKG